jgi:ABC-type sugar transport system permease subunit
MGSANASNTRRGSFRRVLSSDRAFGLLLVAPAALLLATVTVYPVAQIVVISFRRMQLINPAGGFPFVGLENYRRLIFEEPHFWEVWQHTLTFVVAVTGGGFLAGLGISLLLRRVKRGLSALRTLFLLPYVVPSVSLSLLWLWMFNPAFGIANYIADAAGVIDGFKSWFSDPAVAFVPIILLVVWKDSAFHTLMITAGLSRTKPELYDAILVDGGGSFHQFWHVTLPALRPSIVPLLLLSAMFAMQLFSPIWLLSHGGPGFSTTTVAVWEYRLAFERYDFGLAAALGTIWLIVLSTIAALVLWLTLREKA